jgi:hypothetical protein
VSWGTEVSDTDNMHDNVTNNSRITIKTPGVYYIHTQIEWFQQTQRGVYIVRNGTEMLAVSEGSDGVSGDNSYSETDVMIRCAAGDYLEVQVWQALGSAMNIQSSPRSTRFSATWIGGAGQTVDERGVAAVRLKRTTDYTVNWGANSPMPWEAADYDTESMWSSTTNPSRVTAKRAGLYRLSAAVRWDFTPGPAGPWRGYVFAKNGVEIASVLEANTEDPSVQITSTTVMLAAGDYVELYPYNPALSGSIKVKALGSSPQFCVECIGTGKIVTPFAFAYSSTDNFLSVANGGTVAVPFNAEVSDNDSIHDTVTANTRLTCRTAGVYNITAFVHFAAATSNGNRSAGIRINGTTTVGETDLSGVNSSTDYTAVPVSATVELAVGDYVEVVAYQSTGAAVNLRGGSQGKTSLSMVKIGAPNNGSAGVDPVEGWHTVGGAGEPAFQNGWQSVNTTQFKKDRGVVYIKGAVGVTGTPGTIFTLPVGYRPAAGQTVRTFQWDNTGGSPNQVSVDSSGAVTTPVSKSGGGWIGLDMTFRVD